MKQSGFRILVASKTSLNILLIFLRSVLLSLPHTRYQLSTFPLLKYISHWHWFIVRRKRYTLLYTGGMIIDMESFNQINIYIYKQSIYRGLQPARPAALEASSLRGPQPLRPVARETCSP